MEAELTRCLRDATLSAVIDEAARGLESVLRDDGRLAACRRVLRDDLDLDWDAVVAAAAATGTVLEMNGSPHRLDLSVERARSAVAAGCLLAVNSDAHRVGEYEHLRWGISQARRAWVGAGSILNTRSRADLLDWVAAKPARLAGAGLGSRTRRVPSA